MGTVHASYYTDPACPVSWGAEPSLRRLAAQFGPGVEVAYVMGGLARRFEAPQRMAAQCLEEAERTGMPVDVRTWLGETPPASSHPACLAVVAAREQGDPAPYLRRRALRRFGALATAEVAAVCGLPGPRAPVELWRLALEWRVRPERHGTGELWTLA